jgi:hypothetical protein
MRVPSITGRLVVLSDRLALYMSGGATFQFHAAGALEEAGQSFREDGCER